MCCWCAALLLLGCGEQYCQRDVKSGLRCYTINEVEYQETLSRPEPAPERATQPSPGCVLLTSSGPYTMPQGNAGSGSITPPAYLMSGACVSRRQTVQGALR
jgi:hypothetical protein